MTELIVVRPEPLCAETPLDRQEGILTPIERFYVRNNFSMPERPAALSIDGAVGQSLTLTPEALRKLPHRKLSATLECAGNGRAAMNPPVPGEQWGLGAVSTADWEGVSLSTVVRKVEVAADAVELVFHGADGFARSLPIEAALDRDLLLVDAMNGAPLTREHGAPVRLLVPGWYGMASVKWLARIEASTTPFRGHFQVERYVIDGRPVRAMQPRALIIDPPEGATLSLAHRVVRGVAWTGAGRVASVHLSDDGGQTWTAARLLGKHQRYTWRQWEYDWSPKRSAEATLLARATDAKGARQPLEPVWNALGYANNGALPRRLVIAHAVERHRA